MPPLHGTVKDCTNKVVPSLFFLVVVGCITVVLAYSNGIQEPVPRDVTAGLTATLGILVFLFALGRGYLYLQPSPIGHDLEQGTDRLHQTVVPLALQTGQIHSPVQAPQSRQSQVKGYETGGSPSNSSDSNRITVTHPAPGDHIVSPADHMDLDSQDTIVPPAQTSHRHSHGYENRATFETPTRIPRRPAAVHNAGVGGRAHSQNQPQRHQLRYSSIGTAEDALGILPSTWGQQHITVSHPSKSVTKPSLNSSQGRQDFLRRSRVRNSNGQEGMVQGRHQVLEQPVVSEDDLGDSTPARQNEN
ncbi:hypothetical protein ACRALDRAFT_1069812 [Sodiomyces alcalophilus JCM 7366]|uniref:uncharacterized protein n=1 Tax=Sodiomyces alcalophilus JCM 7366 TaxID=591952 RepID=UPI0039B446A2